MKSKSLKEQDDIKKLIKHYGGKENISFIFSQIF